MTIDGIKNKIREFESALDSYNVIGKCFVDSKNSTDTDWWACKVVGFSDIDDIEKLILHHNERPPYVDIIVAGVDAETGIPKAVPRDMPLDYLIDLDHVHEISQEEFNRYVDKVCAAVKALPLEQQCPREVQASSATPVNNPAEQPVVPKLEISRSQDTPRGGDECAGYSVSLSRECTLRELIDEVLTYKGEWGTIHVKNSPEAHIKYSHGRIEQDDTRYDSYIVTDVRANGGWSSMSYYVKVQDPR